MCTYNVPTETNKLRDHLPGTVLRGWKKLVRCVDGTNLHSCVFIGEGGRWQPGENKSNFRGPKPENTPNRGLTRGYHVYRKRPTQEGVCESYIKIVLVTYLVEDILGADEDVVVVRKVTLSKSSYQKALKGW